MFRINIITQTTAIIMVSCSCCSVVSYALWNKTKYFTIPAVLWCVFFFSPPHRFHLFFFLSLSFLSIHLSEHLTNTASSLPTGLFSLSPSSPRCPAPSLSLSLSLYSEAVTLGVHCLGWPHLQLYLPLCVSRSLSLACIIGAGLGL